MITGKISAFYGARVFNDGGGEIGKFPNQYPVVYVDGGKPANHSGEWVKVKGGALEGWVHASQFHDTHPADE